MKLGGFVIAIVLASMIFFSYATISNGFAESYSNTSISDADKLDTSNLTMFTGRNEINETFGDLKSDLIDASSGEGWLGSDVFGGGIAIIKAFTKLPGMIINTLVSTTGDITIILDSMGIPPAIVGGFAIILMIFIFFTIISSFRRHDEV